jgi:hypothetical protein
MKKSILIFLQLCLLIISGKVISQSNLPKGDYFITPGGMFDKVRDRFGNEYNLADLALSSSRTLGNANIASLPTQSCTAGYFRLFFAPGSMFDNNTPAKNVMCNLFTDLSAFITSPLSALTSTLKINIYCNSTPTTSGALGTSSSFYIFPSNPSNPNQGIAMESARYAILSGVDPFFFIWNFLPFLYKCQCNNFLGL